MQHNLISCAAVAAVDVGSRVRQCSAGAAADAAGSPWCPPALGGVSAGHHRLRPPGLHQPCWRERSAGGKGRRCGGCHLVRYCSEACRDADWARHRRLQQPENGGAGQGAAPLPNGLTDSCCFLSGDGSWLCGVSLTVPCSGSRLHRWRHFQTLFQTRFLMPCTALGSSLQWHWQHPPRPGGLLITSIELQHKGSGVGERCGGCISSVAKTSDGEIIAAVRLGSPVGHKHPPMHSSAMAATTRRLHSH